MISDNFNRKLLILISGLTRSFCFDVNIDGAAVSAMFECSRRIILWDCNRRIVFVHEGNDFSVVNTNMGKSCCCCCAGNNNGVDEENNNNEKRKNARHVLYRFFLFFLRLVFDE